VFRELIGLSEERAAKSCADAKEWLGTRPTTTHCRAGLSPHAPYSTRESLYWQATVMCGERGLPLTSHLSESQAEIELLENQSGSLLSLLLELGAWEPSDILTVPEEACHMCNSTRVPAKLFAHCNHADALQLALTKSDVVYCPRTHAAFGHPP